jgi:hypothetical protein
MQERVESTPLGRLVLSVVIVLLLVFVTVFNMPPSRLRDIVSFVGDPAMRATGLDQDWRIFAPDPRGRVIRLEARVKFADGRTATWRVPRGSALVGAYWDYRWQKWTEHMLLDSGVESLWHGTTDYIAREYDRPGDVPVEVELIGYDRTIPAPGDAGAAEPWRARTFYRAAVTVPR